MRITINNVKFPPICSNFTLKIGYDTMCDFKSRPTNPIFFKECKQITQVGLDFTWFQPKMKPRARYIRLLRMRARIYI